MIFFLPLLRPDGTLIWLPSWLVARLKITRGVPMTLAQWDDRELQALLASRIAANEAGHRCTAEWHAKNGYQ